MKLLWLLPALGFILAGCKTTSRATKAGPGAPPAADTVANTNTTSLIVTPGTVSGRISLVNPAGRFAIISFPPGAVPATERRLNVYRSGLKVAELRVTGPQRDLNTAADILAGDCRVGDEVRPD